MNLAVFDFDGTITSKDTLLAFLRFHSGISKYLFNMVLLSPVFFCYALRIIPNWKAKQLMLTLFLKGIATDRFQEKCQTFVNDVLPGLIRPAAIKSIAQHIEQGDRVIVVSASPENWIVPWAKPQGLEVVATQLEIRDNQLTGKIKGKNCYGPEKVNRLEQHLDLKQYTTIFAYGDSKGDFELLSISDVPKYKPFR